MNKVILKPGESSCSMCQRGPQGKDDCPLKGRVQKEYLELDRHDCDLFQVFTMRQVNNRRARAQLAAAEQEALF